MLEHYNIQIGILEKLVNIHKTELNIRHVLDYLEYLKHRVRTLENESDTWEMYFGRLP
jgi:hypothetical protein